MNLTSSHFPSPGPFKHSAQLDINPQLEKPESGLSTYSCNFQVEVSDCQKTEAEQWREQNVTN